MSSLRSRSASIGLRPLSTPGPGTKPATGGRRPNVLARARFKRSLSSLFHKGEEIAILVIQTNLATSIPVREFHGPNHLDRLISQLSKSPKISPAVNSWKTSSARNGPQGHPADNCSLVVLPLYPSPAVPLHLRFQMHQSADDRTRRVSCFPATH